MDFLTLGFLYWVWNIFAKVMKIDDGRSNLSDTEHGAAYFFSSDHFNSNKGKSESMNREHDDGPNW